MRHYFDFEKEVELLDAQIELLRNEGGDSQEILRKTVQLNKEVKRVLKKVYSELTPMQTYQVARHLERPFTLDYIFNCFTGFTEVHGDRMYGDDRSIITGYAWFEDRPVAVMGHQRGRDTEDRMLRNFGMPSPEGYRKALRVMKTAARFDLPVVTLIDTPGAYPGIGAEERGQSEAIARNLQEMIALPTPIVSIVIGEGGSGGALALAVADIVLMLEFAVYSVISPEGAAAILWKSKDYAAEAASQMGITAKQIKSLKIANDIISEPLGGAHRDHKETYRRFGDALGKALRDLDTFETEALLERRYQLWRNHGKWKRR